MTGSAVVIGSVHMDLIARAASLPALGESVTGGTFAMAPGGKGGNQAVQLALNGIVTTMVTRVGDDAFGQSLIAALERKGVNTTHIGFDSSLPTGASVVLADAHDYASIIAPGAAASLSLSDLEAARDVIAAADAVLVQWELPSEIVAETIAFCVQLGVRVVFNASPVGVRAALAPAIWSAIDWLVVNRFEATRLLDLGGGNPIAISELAERLRVELGPANVLITLGAEGSYWLGYDGSGFQSAMPAEVIDTVGAGDAFLGTFVAALIEAETIPSALQRGAAAGALAVSRPGAYDALPARIEIDRLLAARHR